MQLHWGALQLFVRLIIWFIIMVIFLLFSFFEGSGFSGYNELLVHSVDNMASHSGMRVRAWVVPVGYFQFKHYCTAYRNM